MINGILREELNSFKTAYSEALNDSDSHIQEILDYVKNDNGKLIRPALFFLCQGLVKKPDINTVSIAVLLELLHTATLVHDDIIDNSEVRRGRNTAKEIWSNKSAVLLGDFLFSKVLKIGLSSKFPEVMQTTAKIVYDMAREELYQSLKTDFYVPSEDDYFLNIQKKTGGLFEASCYLGGVVSAADPKQLDMLYEIGRNFGMAYQIIDDIMDYTGNEKIAGKNLRRDIFNGVLTLPFIYTYNGLDNKTKKHFKKSVQERSEQGIYDIYDYIVNNGGIYYAKQKAEKCFSDSITLIEKFDNSIYRKEFVQFVRNGLTRFK